MGGGMRILFWSLSIHRYKTKHFYGTFQGSIYSVGIFIGIRWAFLKPNEFLPNFKID